MPVDHLAILGGESFELESVGALRDLIGKAPCGQGVAPPGLAGDAPLPIEEKVYVAGGASWGVSSGCCVAGGVGLGRLVSRCGGLRLTCEVVKQQCLLRHFSLT